MLCTLEHALPRCRCIVSNLLGLPCRGWQARRHICIGTPLDARSHYNALGITPSASQAEVKAAYYKLTKLYHPDSQAAGNSESEDHIKKFREVTAAYEVLGNVKLRRLYDKGMMHVGSDTRPHAGAWRVKEDDDPSLKFYRSRDVKSRPPPPTNNIPVYDFDEWSKQHYGATFAREQELKRKRAVRTAAATSRTSEVKVERILVVMGVMVATLMIINADMTNHDQATYVRETAARASDKTN